MQIHKEKIIHVFFAQKRRRKAVSRDWKTPKASKRKHFMPLRTAFSFRQYDPYPKQWKTQFGMNWSILFFLRAVLS